MQQSWFLHIHLYFDGPEFEGDVDGLEVSDKQKLQGVWKAVVDEARKSNVVLTVEEQRLNTSRHSV